MRTLCENSECDEVFDNTSKRAKYCPECRPIMKSRFINKRKKELVEIARERNICGVCLKNQATLNFTSCKRCRDRQNLKYYHSSKINKDILE